MVLSIKQDTQTKQALRAEKRNNMAKTTVKTAEAKNGLKRGDKRFPRVPKTAGVTPSSVVDSDTGYRLGDQLMDQGMLVLNIAQMVQDLADDGAFRQSGISVAKADRADLVAHYVTTARVNWANYCARVHDMKPVTSNTQSAPGLLKIMTPEYAAAERAEAAADLEALVA